MKRIILIFFGMIMCSLAFSQSVGIGTNNPHPSAALEIADSSKGILIPRMTMDQRNAIQNPAEGLMVYQTDSTKGFWFYSNQAWNKMNSTNEGNSGNSVGGNMAVFKTSGTFVVPQGVKSVIVELWGAGGGGTQGTAGRRGAWGKQSTNVIPGMTYPVIVGVGGGSGGGTGTTSSFNGIYAEGGPAGCNGFGSCPPDPVSNAIISCFCSISIGSTLGYGSGGSCCYGCCGAPGANGLVILYY